MTERERQDMREARAHKKNFISFVGSILSKQDRGFDDGNLPSPYDEAKAASDTEAPNTEDVGNFVSDKLAKVIKPDRKRETKQSFNTATK